MSRRERGAALLMAMLTVALVATFAAAAMWQQWRGIEVESAERQRDQAEWILTGALDWARLVLREDARAGATDHLGEPWAVPLQEARLSSFLAADQGGSADMSGSSGDVLDAFLSGQIVDAQGLMNVTNLIDSTGKVSTNDFEAFTRLFELLDLPSAQLETLTENIRAALDTSTDNRSAPSAPLVPQTVAQLVWLGLAPQTVAALEPFVTVLPVRTPVNLNTASAEVIAATLGVSIGDARNLVGARGRSPFKSASEAINLLPGGAAGNPASAQAAIGVATNYFEVHSRLRLEQFVLEEHALVQRDPSNALNVKVLSRERGVRDPTAMSQAAAAQQR